jgi:hypothetical protein
MAEVVVASAGVVLLACALVASQPWLDRHMLPSFYVMRQWYTRAEFIVRMALGVGGLAMLFLVRPRIGWLAATYPGRVVSMFLAAVLGVVAGERVLAWTHPSTEWLVAQGEPLRQVDARLGWTYVPSRAGRKTVAGREIEFAFDAAGERVRRVDEPVQRDAPAIVFTGESVMAGEGLTWDETIPALVGSMMGVQSANLAVHGYATDQAYLRLQAELPEFRRPLAVVTLFMTALFGRDLDDDRPHLGPGLEWMPPVTHGRVGALSRLIVPFRRESTVERGIATTRDVLRATVALAEARGATPLILVPQFNREDDLERSLRRRILDDAGLPYVFVEFESDWRLSGDLHPNARTAHALAEAVAARLKRTR